MPKHDVISLGWQVLSQPQLVDGPSASSLMQQLFVPSNGNGSVSLSYTSCN